MQQLSGQDASFVYLEIPHTPMHIGSVGIYDPSTAPGGARMVGMYGLGPILDSMGLINTIFPMSTRSRSASPRIAG